jgi:hypothetical protein
MKAQFEAMGLAVIVVLVSVGMLLVVYFSFDSTESLSQRYENEQLSQNVIEAMLKTSIKDCSLTVADTIEDIGIYNRNPCGDSKERLKEAADTILNETLDARGRSYYFVVREADANNLPTETVYYTGGNCDVSSASTDGAGHQPLRLYPSPKTVIVALWICKEKTT